MGHQPGPPLRRILGWNEGLDMSDEAFVPRSGISDPRARTLPNMAAGWHNERAGMSNDPLTITLDKVVDLLRGLGLDPVDVTDILSVHIDPGVVTVTRFRNGDDGRGVLVGTGENMAPATETVTIQVKS